MFEETRQFKVVVNDEGQYSLWPADRICAPGWREDGMRGERDECLSHIRAVWTDMRPASLRRAHAAEG